MLAILSCNHCYNDMDKGVNEITIDEAVVLFDRSHKQIRRVIEQSVGGKKGPDGSYEVRPDPLFARRIPQPRGSGFLWLIDKDRMSKHFEEKLERQMKRIEAARRASLGLDKTEPSEKPVNTTSTESKTKTVPEPKVQISDSKDILKVYEGLVETYKQQIQAKDQQLESKDKHISALIEEVSASKKRSDTLQGALIAIAQGKQLDMQRIQEGEVAIVDAEDKPKEPPVKRGWFSGLFGGRD